MVELDGGQHAIQAEADQRRSVFLRRRGFRVLRFWDNQVLEDIDAVLERIVEALRDPHPYPLPDRERVNNTPALIPEKKQRGKDRL